MNELVRVAESLLPIITLFVLLAMLIRGELHSMATEKLKSRYAEKLQQGLGAEEMVVLHSELRDEKLWNHKRYVSASLGIVAILLSFYLFYHQNFPENWHRGILSGLALGVGIIHFQRFWPDQRRRLLIKLAGQLKIQLLTDVTS
jgi:hypothetical protein